MERFATFLTDCIAHKNAITEEDYEIYKYGFLTGLELFVYMVTCLTVAIWMGMTVECIVFLLIFFCLRSFVGGLHMNSFKVCFLFSCIVTFFSLLVIKYCPISKEISIVASVCEIIFIFFLPPVENVNRLVDEKEKIIFSLKIKKILLALFLLVIFFYISGLDRYLTTVTYTLAVIIFSMFLGKYKNTIDECKGIDECGDIID